MGMGIKDMPQAPMGDSEEPSGSPSSSSSGKAAPAEFAPEPEPLTAKFREKRVASVLGQLACKWEGPWKPTCSGGIKHHAKTWLSPRSIGMS